NSFDHLTVDQICNEALLHRSSFYRYFNDKYDLLEQTMDAQISQIADSGESEEDVVKQFVLYIDGHKDMIRHLASSNSHSSLYTEMLQVFSQVLLDRRDHGTKDTVIKALQQASNPEMMAYVLAGRLSGPSIGGKRIITMCQRKSSLTLLSSLCFPFQQSKLIR